MKAQIALNVICPKCGFVMTRIESLVTCKTPNCALQNVEYKPPYYTLEPIEDAELEYSQTRVTQGDLLVVKVAADSDVSPEKLRQLEGRVAERLPEGAESIIFWGDIEVSVVNRDVNAKA